MENVIGIVLKNPLSSVIAFCIGFFLFFIVFKKIVKAVVIIALIIAGVFLLREAGTGTIPAFRNTITIEKGVETLRGIGHRGAALLEKGRKAWRVLNEEEGKDYSSSSSRYTLKKQ